MKVALIGYGAMGQLVAVEARKAGCDVGAVLTSDNAESSAQVIAAKLQGHDVAIDFSVGDAVPRNVEACARARVALVEGTTGWMKNEAAVIETITRLDGALVYGANFSIGVNVFYRIVKYASTLFAAVEGYDSFIQEAHHVRKRDAPSGTALRLRDLMSEKIEREIPIASTRAGHIPGTHIVGFDAEADQITLSHVARSRQGFATGALLAAHWIVGRKGMFEFTEVIESIVKD